MNKLDNKKYSNFNNKPFVVLMLIFFFVLVNCLAIKYKISEKDELIEHEVAHLGIPEYAIGMNLYYDKVFFLMKDMADHIHIYSETQLIKSEYTEAVNKLLLYRENFEKITNVHDVRWFATKEELGRSPEHQDVHDENLRVASESKDDYDKFIIMSDQFFDLVEGDRRDEASKLFNIKILPLNNILKFQMERFMELQEWEKGYHINEFRDVQRSTNNFILVLVVNIVALVIVWIILFFRFIYRYK